MGKNKKPTNKIVRQKKHGEAFREAKKSKGKERRRKQNLEAKGIKVERRKTRTIENVRSYDETTLLPPDAEEDWEVFEEYAGEDAHDEFASYFDDEVVQGGDQNWIQTKVNKRKQENAEGMKEEEEEDDEDDEELDDEELRRALERGNAAEGMDFAKEDEEGGSAAAFAEALGGGKDGKSPKILITTSEKRPGKRTVSFLKEFLEVIPSMFFYHRRDFTLKDIIKFAKKREFTSVIVVAERALKGPSGLYITSLPEGPTLFFRLTGLKLGQEMPHGVMCNAHHHPELFFNNFNSRLSHRVARQLTTLFPKKTHFKGRRMITFHNQRDFIFFRHHRYVFRNLAYRDEEEKERRQKNARKEDRYDEDKDARARIVEIGPRFTLKLRYLQQGTFDSKGGVYEYLWRPDSNVSRAKFVM